MNIETRFSHDKVKHDQENNVHLVVSLKAPKTDWQKKRPPICIIPVVDVSGSMEGQKIDYAKKSVMKLIDHLQPGDYCGLVTFTTDVETVFKPVEVTQSKKEQLRAKVQELHAQHSTNFAGGMLEGLEHLNKSDLPDGCILRVVMLTDGIANCGPAVAPNDILNALKANLGKGTVSAFGYGTDCNQELLSSVAKVGKGNYAYIKNPDDALSAFAKELGGLLSTYAQNILIEVAPHNGHVIEEVLSDVDVEQKDKTVKIKLPEIFAEEERHLVLSFKLSEQTQALPRAMNVADVNVSYDLLDENAKKTTKTEELKAKIQFVKDGEQQEKPTPEVDKIIGLAQLVKAQVEAESHAARGEYKTAGGVMLRAENSLRARGLTAHANVARGLAPRMASAGVYAASGGYRASMKGANSRAYGTSGMDDEAYVQVQAMGVVAENSVQVDLMREFTTNENVVPPVNVAVSPGGEVKIAAPPGGSIKISAPAKKEKKEKTLAKKRSTSRW